MLSYFPFAFSPSTSERPLRRFDAADYLIKADRAYYDGENSHKCPTYGRSRRYGVGYDPNAKASYSC